MELLCLTSTPAIKDSETTPTEFLKDAPPKQSITLSWLLVMELKMELTTGWLKIPGDQTGETKDISRSGVETTSVALEDTAMLPVVTRPREACLIHQ